MMTKKNYIRAAAIIKQETIPSYRETLALTFIRFFQEDNPRFDIKRFREACDVVCCLKE